MSGAGRQPSPTGRPRPHFDRTAYCRVVIRPMPRISPCPLTNARLRSGLVSLVLGLTLSAGCSSLLSSSADQRLAALVNDKELQLGMAQRAERRGALADARNSYQAILAGDGNSAVAHHRLGVVLTRLENLPEALEHLERARELGEPSSELWGDLGYARYLADDLNGAESALRQALQADPANKRHWNNLGLVLGQVGDHQGSLDAFRKGGTEAEALSNFGFVLTQRGDLATAAKYFHQALEIDSNLEPAAQGLVDLYQRGYRSGGDSASELPASGLPTPSTTSSAPTSQNGVLPTDTTTNIPLLRD